MNKNIILSNDERISINEYQTYYGNYTEIIKSYFINGELERIINFSMIKDICIEGKFSGSEKEINETTELVFKFKKNDPIYKNLIILLNGQHEIILNDYYEMNKNVCFSRKEDEIDIIFKNYNQDVNTSNKFYVVTSIKDEDFKIRFKEFFQLLKIKLLYNEYNVKKLIKKNNIL